MKIKTKVLSYDEVMALPRPEHKKPVKPGFILRSLVRLLSQKELKEVEFSWENKQMEDAAGPCLILMNHCCFTDLQIVSRLFYPKPYGIVCTSDGFVGKAGLMRALGCIPTKKFVTDLTLIQDMEYMLHEKKASVLMYPEASYSFDGTTTPLPRKLGVLLKKLNVPVVTVITQGSFQRQPLYNGLKKRKVQIHAQVNCLLTPEEIQEASVAQIDALLDRVFTLDYFKWQQDNHIKITEKTRADGLNRILYRCPHCGSEGRMFGKGTRIVCRHCGAAYELTEEGALQGLNVEPVFTHIPSWYAWERGLVRTELENGTYRLETKVRIGMMVDEKAIYMVGEGILYHDENGFRLTGCDGKLSYTQSPLASYGLYADYYWYEIGDVICIGNHEALYYCFPMTGDVAAKTRLAAEELYKIKKKRI